MPCDELKRCSANPNLTGLKLHLPTAGFELANEDHRKKLSAVLSFCNENDVPILMHLDSLNGEFGPRETTSFWKDIVAPHENLKLILAHLGSTGGYSSRAAALLDSLDTLRKANKLPCAKNVYFDLSGAILLEETDGLPTTNADRKERLVKHMRSIGLDRFLPASDFPALPPKALLRTFKKIKLTNEEIRILRSNVASFLK